VRIFCATSQRQHQLPSTGMLIDGVHNPHHSSEVPPRSRHADACPENGVVLLYRSSPTASDPPICTYFFVPEAGSCPGAFPSGLRQRRVGEYSRQPNASTPVGSECSGMADLQSETLRPHHRCTRQPSLAAGGECVVS